MSSLLSSRRKISLLDQIMRSDATGSNGSPVQLPWPTVNHVQRPNVCSRARPAHLEKSQGYAVVVGRTQNGVPAKRTSPASFVSCGWGKWDSPHCTDMNQLPASRRST